MRVEPQPFDLWLAADLRARFGELQQLPDELAALLDVASPEE